MVVPLLTNSILKYLSVWSLQRSLVTLGLPREEFHFGKGQTPFCFHSYKVTTFLQILSAEQYDLGPVRSRHHTIMSRVRRNRNHYLV